MACRSGHGQGSTDFPGGVRGGGETASESIGGEEGSRAHLGGGGQNHRSAHARGRSLPGPVSRGVLWGAIERRGLPKSCRLWKDRIGGARPHRVMFKMGMGSQR